MSRNRKPNKASVAIATNDSVTNASVKDSNNNFTFVAYFISTLVILLFSLYYISAANLNEMKNISAANFNEMKNISAANLNEMKILIDPVVKNIADLSNNFNKFTNFEVNNVAMLKRVTNSVNLCGSFATSVNVMFSNKFATLTVSHFDCTNYDVNVKGCETIDMLIVLNDTMTCPMGPSLDISIENDILDGEKVVAFGVADNGIGRNWLGNIASSAYHRDTIASKVGESEFCQHPLTGCGIGHSNTIVANADQVSGMSGAIVVSRHAIVGMSVATDRPLKRVPSPSSGEGDSDFIEELPRHRQTLIIPLANIHFCLRQNLALFKSRFDCPHSEVIGL